MLPKNYHFDLTKIDEMLKSRGKTRNDLAKALGKSFNTVKKMLDEKAITTGNLEQIAKFLDVSLLEFVRISEGQDRITLREYHLDWLASTDKMRAEYEDQIERLEKENIRTYKRLEYLYEKLTKQQQKHIEELEKKKG